MTVKNNNLLILASASKSRASILKQAGVDFQCIPPFCDEEKIKLRAYLIYLERLKSKTPGSPEDDWNQALAELTK